MAAWSKLFTGFKTVFSKEVAVEAGKVGEATAKTIAKKEATAAASKAVSKVSSIEKAAITKPASVNTATKMYTQSGGESFLKTQAKDIAGSKIVKTTGKVAAGAVIIGGAAYGIGALSGKGMESVGYGWRDLTNSHTPQETIAEDLANRSASQDLDQKQFDFLKDFYSWAQKNGYTDSPSVREFYDNYINPTKESEALPSVTSSNIDPWLLAAGALAAGAGIYLYTKRKKGKKKK